MKYLLPAIQTNQNTVWQILWKMLFQGKIYQKPGEQHQMVHMIQTLHSLSSMWFQKLLVLYQKFSLSLHLLVLQKKKISKWFIQIVVHTFIDYMMKKLQEWWNGCLYFFYIFFISFQRLPQIRLVAHVWNMSLYPSHLNNWVYSIGVKFSTWGSIICYW